MLAYPQPSLAPFQVTLLPDQLQPSPENGASSSDANVPSTTSGIQEAVQRESWAAATSMLHSILDLAIDYCAPQIKFASYSPEKVMRSVRDIVDAERCKELVECLQAAVRQYAVQSSANIAEMRRQRLAASATKLSPSRHADEEKSDRERSSSSDRADGEEDGDDTDTPEATLDAVQTLAALVTYYERLQHGVAELGSVWAHANMWCTLQASCDIPRSLIAAATQESSSVFRGEPELLALALKGYRAVLKAELEADTATLDRPAPSAMASSLTSGVAQLKSPATAADAQMDVSALKMLACPPSIASLTTAHRHRLLFLFMQLTRDAQQYNTVVEPVAVALVRRHFEGVARRWWAEEMTAKKYFELSEIALKHADTVHQQFLHSGTIPLVEDAIQATLIGSVGAEVLKRDFTLLMEQEQYHALRLAWRLLSASAHVRSAPVVVTLFCSYLLECGQGIMEELVPNSPKATPAGVHAGARERPFLAVRHLIGLLEQGSRTVESCFHECEKEFKVALHEALQTILEAYPGAFSEQLAAYQDAIMKEVEVGHVPVSLSAAAKHHGVGVAASRQQEAEEEEVEKRRGHANSHSRGTGGTFSKTPVHDEEENDGAEEVEDRRRAAREKEEEDEDEAEGGPSPHRRPRAEVASTAAGRPDNAAASATATATATVGPGETGEEARDASLGAAALRHAAPIPAEAKEATPVLRRIAYIYSYHPKKDLFEAAYWRDLARRCLHPHRKVDVAAENAFIFYLRDICGLSFTSKFEGMLTDLETSAQLTSQYRTWSDEQAAAAERQANEEDGTANRARSAVETHLLILTQSFWPKYAAQPPRLYVPPSLRRVTDGVGKFYAGLFQNRHLTWQLPLANATLRAQMAPQRAVFTLIGTYTQCMMLMRLDALYDKGVTAVTVKALCDGVGVDCTNTEVLWSLQGLCHPRFRLVLCDAAAPVVPASVASAVEAEEGGVTGGLMEPTASSPAAPAPLPATLTPSDVVRLNLHFNAATPKVRIPLQTRARTTAAAGMDGTGRSARTADNGGHLVEVAIVSCLKARRTVSHADLVAEVNTRLPFPVSVPMLKKAIDKMIERGFMVRGKDATYQFSA